MEIAGPTFIKLAQWAASRTDIFPQEMCLRLSKLHSAVYPHPFEFTKKVIENFFNEPLEQVFSEFDQIPIGVGAIAQVYKASIRPEFLKSSQGFGDFNDCSENIKIFLKKPTVAIKVLHPKAEKMIKRDLKILLVFARIFNTIPNMQWLSFPEEVLKFGEMMQSQLDLRIEAYNLLEFQKNFKERYAVKFPTPLIKYSTKDMLIEEYKDALPISLFLENGCGAYGSRIADMGKIH
nr:1876_t:CDS:2 [Entrophospora candida]